MGHQDIANSQAQAARVDPLKRFGIKLPTRTDECVADWQARMDDAACYQDQLAFNHAKWDATELVIEAWKRETAGKRRLYDITFNREPENTAGEAIQVVDSVLESIPDFVAQKAREWNANQKKGGRKFDPSYATFQGFFKGLKNEIAGAQGDTRKALDELHDPLTMWSNNSAYTVDKFGFRPITAAQRHQRTAAAKTVRANNKKARAVVNIAKVKAAFAEEEKRRTEAIRAQRRADRTN